MMQLGKKWRIKLVKSDDDHAGNGEKAEIFDGAPLDCTCSVHAISDFFCACVIWT